MYKQYFEQIIEIISEDLGNRGLSQTVQNDDFYGAIESLLESSTVMIITGFCIRDKMVGETDGPLGTIALASALEEIGKEVVLVTDQYSKDLLMACCSIKKVRGSIEVVPEKYAESFCKEMLFKHNPSHIVALERPGRALDGKCYSMRGEDLSAVVPNTDPLFIEGKKRGAVTIAIGDGGNEMGMGKLRQHIIQNVNRGEEICALTSADYLIVAGVSNWGGQGIAAALSIRTSSMLLHDAKTEQRLLRTIVEKGAVDGCSKKNEMTVDGLSLEENLGIVTKLRMIIEEVVDRVPDSAIDEETRLVVVNYC